ncbi:MAG: hypothetical protein U0451_02200 [Candidatus Saccharimonadales bacterium]
MQQIKSSEIATEQGREIKLAMMQQNVLAVTALRENTQLINPELGNIDGTYHEFLKAII